MEEVKERERRGLQRSPEEKEREKPRGERIREEREVPRDCCMRKLDSEEGEEEGQERNSDRWEMGALVRSNNM